MSSFFGTRYQRVLGVTLTADTKRLETGLSRAERKIAGFGRSANALNVKGGKAGLAAFAKGGSFAIGGAVALQVAKDLAVAASNLNEQVSASDVVFRGASKAVKDWSTTTADAFGIARTEALAAANDFGALFVNMGQTTREAAVTSERLVELAGDLASFKNTGVEDALAALRSGLAGEAEPLRKFQVFLTEAKVAQEALAATGKKTTKELTIQDKTLARLAIIMRETSLAQGDAARTSGSLANQTRRLRAQTDDLQAKLGEKLVPVFSLAAQEANTMLDAVDALFGGLERLGNISIPVIGKLEKLAKVLKYTSGLTAIPSLTGKALDVVGLGGGGGSAEAQAKQEKTAAAAAKSAASQLQQAPFGGSRTRTTSSSGMVVNGDIHVNGVTNVKSLLAEIDKVSKRTATQPRGRAPALKPGNA